MACSMLIVPILAAPVGAGSAPVGAAFAALGAAGRAASPLPVCAAIADAHANKQARVNRTNLVVIGLVFELLAGFSGNCFQIHSHSMRGHADQAAWHTYAQCPRELQSSEVWIISL